MDLSWKRNVDDTNGANAGEGCPVKFHKEQEYSPVDKSRYEEFPSESIGTRTPVTKYFEKGDSLDQEANRGCSSKIENFGHQGYISVTNDNRQDSLGVKKRISLKKSSRSGIWAAALPSDTESTPSENEEENLDSLGNEGEKNDHHRIYLNETENDGDDENSDNIQDDDDDDDKADNGNSHINEVGMDCVEPSTTDCKESPYFTSSYTAKECFICKICDKMFADRNFYRKHMQQCHSEKHKCPICCRTYSRVSSLKVHMKVLHTNEKPYLCDICGQSFGWAGALSKHMGSHSQLKLFTCEKCGKSFANSWNLKSHAVVHDEEKPYQCEECGRKFLRLNTLRYHQRTHTNERPYQCDVCGRTFTQPNSLKTHQKVHSIHSTNDPPAEEKIKKYGCELCGRMFALKNTLNVHMMRHKGERPHKCLICQKSFTQSSTLNIHMRTHTGDKPYACDVCGMHFAYNYALQKHVSKHVEMGEVGEVKQENLEFDNDGANIQGNVDDDVVKQENLEYDNDGANIQENSDDDETIAANQAAVEEIKLKILQTLSRAKTEGGVLDDGHDDNREDSSKNNDVDKGKDVNVLQTEIKEKRKKVTPNDFLAVFQSSFQNVHHSE
ncbi:zinc finger and SCAN domain-containing protein 2-like [Palaemon carinicauda]|uniref:zinc finger and SCAN domain-containing protein 2-like n=1 Tax=Palaemon carinicauda TaxID=392227 RepID=UPI0035B5C13D